MTRLLLPCARPTLHSPACGLQGQQALSKRQQKRLARATTVLASPQLAPEASTSSSCSSSVCSEAGLLKEGPMSPAGARRGVKAARMGAALPDKPLRSQRAGA